MDSINIKFTAFISKELGKKLKDFFVKIPYINIAVNKDAFLIDIQKVTGYWGEEPLSGLPFLKEYLFYKTDDRSFNQVGTHRLQLSASIDVSKIGLTSFYNQNTKYFKPTAGDSERYTIYFDRFFDNRFTDKSEVKKANPTSGLELVYPTFKNSLFSSLTDILNSATIQASTSAGYPFTNPLTTPNIDIDLKLKILKTSDRIYCYFTGTHNLFPCYELICNGKLIYMYDPIKFKRLGPDPINLNRTQTFEKAIYFSI